MKQINRRSFQKTAVAASSTIPLFSIGKPGLSANSKVNVAMIGAGNIAGQAYGGTRSENIVALCDVDSSMIDKNLKKHPGNPTAARFSDFRVMLDKMGTEIDMVCVNTPDHTHFAASIAAMERGQPEPYILSGRRVPLPELAGLVAEAAGVGAPLGTVPMWVAKGVAPLATGWARVWGGEAKITRESLETLEFRGRFRHHKASECWGYAPRPITEPVKDTVAGWRDQGGLGAS